MGLPSSLILLGSYVFGDFNCDGRFNGGDSDPFFLALSAPTAYAKLSQTAIRYSVT